VRYHTYVKAEPSCSHLLAEQATKLLFDYPIAFADSRLQSLPVEDGDAAAGVLDQSRRLEVAGCVGDPLAAHPQHVGDELLGELQFVDLHPIVGEQKPAAEALFHRV
jgi:hypothetical protein